MLHIFQYDNATGNVELMQAEILLTREFAALMEFGRNICTEDPKGIKRLRAFKEFKYIWLALDWNSVYANYSEQERHQEALKDSGLTEEEFNDPTFRAACRKYRALQESNRSIRALHSAQQLVDRIIDYFGNVDPQERDEQTGKPIWKVKDLQTEIDNLSKMNDSLKVLESQVKKEMVETSSLRGGAVEGFTPTNY